MTATMNLTEGSSIEPAPATRRGPAPSADVCARLKQETAAEHAAIEAVSGIAHAGLTRGEYRAYLERWLGFLAPLEAELRRREVWSVLGLDAAERAKLPALRRDLSELGAEPAALPLCELPELPGLQEALGCAYVIEGSTLGGRVLARHVQNRLGAGVPRRFVEVYGPHTGERWQAFRAALNAHASAPDAQDRAIAGARTTFREFTRWLARR